MSIQIGLSAGDVKDAIRRHHPAWAQGGFVGQWVCVEEWCGIDLLALDARSSANVIGYEVKVSRGDYRSELLDPTKRMEAVGRCTQFYFAVPAGLLKPEEIAFEEPDWSLDDFERVDCPGVMSFDQSNSKHSWHRGTVGGKCRNPRHDHRGKSRRRAFVPKDLPKGFSVRVPVPAVLDMRGYGYIDERELPRPHDIEQAIERQGFQIITCPTCAGRGYSELSRVERESPTLWVPKDVGLVEVDARGITVVKRAPKNKMPKLIVGDLERGRGKMREEDLNRIQRKAIAELARWISNRPDPRHAL